MASHSYLVTGATGNQGGSAARELLRAGAKVHVLVRDPSKPAAKELEALGAIVFAGDFADVDAINKATRGVKGIFMNPFPELGNVDGEAKQVQRFIDAAKAAESVDTLVLSTSTWCPHHQSWLADPGYLLKDLMSSKVAAEETVRASGLQYTTILRPSWLLNNYIQPNSNLHYPELPSTGELRSAILPDLPLTHLAAEDVGRFAAAALLDPKKFAGQEISLGVADISIAEVVKEINAVTGTKTPVSHIEPTELLKDPSKMYDVVRGAFGLWTNKVQLRMNEEEFGAQKTFGIQLTSVREWVDNNRAALLVNFK